jgi:DNA phosphorothioation-associated putative methyltransferase
VIGKWTREAVYVHRSAWPLLPPWQRERIRRAVRIAGHREASAVDVAKIRHDGSVVSLLDYPLFETDPHPALFRAFTVNLKTGTVRVAAYQRGPSQPLLHRKEEMVASSHPRYARWAAQTRAEEECGLYPKELLSRIGFRRVWEPMWEKAQPCLRRRLGKTAR